MKTVWSNCMDYFQTDEAKRNLKESIIYPMGQIIYQEMYFHVVESQSRSVEDVTSLIANVPNLISHAIERMALQTTTITQHIKTLLHLDEEIGVLQDQLRELRKQKEKTEEVVLATMVERKWSTINAGKCVLSIAEKKQYSSLSFTYLEKTLSQIIPDKAQKEYVMKYVKDNRELKIRQEIILAHKEM